MSSLQMPKVDSSILSTKDKNNHKFKDVKF